MICLAHWLAIEGKQPTVNENPEIISKADLTADSLDPVRVLKAGFLKFILIYFKMKSLTKKRYNLDASKIKTSNPHELSLVREKDLFEKHGNSSMFRNNKFITKK